MTGREPPAGGVKLDRFHLDQLANLRSPHVRHDSRGAPGQGTRSPPGLFDWSDAELSQLTAEVAAADIAIFASPTYKAAYTGMLKAFLDRYGSNGLAGIIAVPVMTGGWPGHLLAVEVHLRPVLVELGATVPARGLYVTEPEFAELDAAVTKWAQTAVPLIRRALP